MKNLTNYLSAFLLTSAMFFAGNAKAQTATGDPFKFSIGLEGGLPTFDLHHFSKVEAGGTLRLQYNIKSQFAFTLTSGYYNLFPTNKDNATTQFAGDTYDNKPHSQGIIPVKIGVKNFVSKGFYWSAETGAGFETKYDTRTKFIVAPGFGFATDSFDLGFRYEYFADVSQSNANYGFAGVRVGFAF